MATWLMYGHDSGSTNQTEKMKTWERDDKDESISTTTIDTSFI